MHYNLEGKIVQGGTMTLDATLTLQSAAAQAKATGDAINAVKETANAHVADMENPHGVTKAQLGLGEVDNTADLDKPVSNKQEAAIELAVTAAKNEMEVLLVHVRDTAEGAQTAADEAKTAAENATKAAEDAVEQLGSTKPEAIGAEKERLQFTDTPLYIASFAEDTTYADFPFRAAIPLSGVTADMTPEVVLGITEAMSGIFAPIAATYDGGVYLYATDKVENDTTIPTIICWKKVGA